MQASKLKLAVVGFVIGVFIAGCSLNQLAVARQVSSDVHAVLATADDTEEVLFASGTVPKWDADHHKRFSAHMAVALKAGLALNEAVKTAPVSPEAKADLATVSAELAQLEAISAEVLPADSKLAVNLLKVDSAIVKLIPLFLS